MNKEQLEKMVRNDVKRCSEQVRDYLSERRVLAWYLKSYSRSSFLSKHSKFVGGAAFLIISQFLFYAGGVDVLSIERGAQMVWVIFSIPTSVFFGACFGGIAGNPMYEPLDVEGPEEACLQAMKLYKDIEQSKYVKIDDIKDVLAGKAHVTKRIVVGE